MNHILSYAGYYSGYKVVNENNLFNFMYITMNSLPKEGQQIYIDNCRLIMGNTFLQAFKWYVFNKFKDSPLLAFF